jgi:hypothetical protein
MSILQPNFCCLKAISILLQVLAEAKDVPFYSRLVSEVSFSAAKFDDSSV